jgi:tripartite-type tricarboxylate transporter receptor subunit TctC
MKKIIAACAAALLLAGIAWAETYPNRPIRIIYSFLPGPTDAVLRYLATAMSNDLGQPIVFENKMGANGRIGTAAVVASRPDGYTLLITAAGSITIGPQLDPVPYDPLNDLRPVTQIVAYDAVIVVNNKFPARNLQEFIAQVKAAPKKYSYGTAGTGGAQHIAGELLKDALGIDMTHVPYRGDAAALTDLIGGQIPIAILAMSTVSPYIASGAIRPIASLGAKRFPTFPNLPTIGEQVLPGFQGGTWLGLFVPAGTPDAIVDRVYKSVNKALSTEAIRKQLADGGGHVVNSSPKEFEAFLKEEYQRYGKVLKSGKVEK